VLLLRDLIRRLPDWDTPSKLSLGLAVAFLVIALLVAAFGSEATRLPAMAVVLGLVMLTQVIILWGNRGMVTAYTRAQRHYLAGEFQAARELLESEIQQGKPTAEQLTLLGNVYRQLGDLERSERVLQQAVAHQPQAHFPLYGLGMTLLAQGRYEDAIVRIRQSLSYGAPSVVQFDLGHSLFRAGYLDDAKSLLRDAADSVRDEPHRQLMRSFLLNQLGDSQIIDDALLEAGLPFWQASAARFRMTTYGQALQADIQALGNQLHKDKPVS